MSGASWSYRGFDMYTDWKPFPIVRISIASSMGLAEVDEDNFVEYLNSELPYKGQPKSQLWSDETLEFSEGKFWSSKVIMIFTDEREITSEADIEERCDALDKQAQAYLDRLVYSMDLTHVKNRAAKQ
jgi:hypothetical protein